MEKKPEQRIDENVFNITNHQAWGNRPEMTSQQLDWLL